MEQRRVGILWNHLKGKNSNPDATDNAAFAGILIKF